jgi:hypothetical protein
MAARLQLVVHQEREHPNPGRWKEESRCPGAFLGFWTTGEKGRDVGSKAVGDRRFTQAWDQGRKGPAFHFGFCLSSSLFFRFCAVDAKFKRSLCENAVGRIESASRFLAEFLVEDGYL